MKTEYEKIKQTGKKALIGLAVLYGLNFSYHQNEISLLKNDLDFIKHEKSILEENLEQKKQEGSSKNYKKRFIGPWIKNHWGENIQNPEYKGEAEWILCTTDKIGYNLWESEKNTLEQEFYQNKRMQNYLEQKVDSHKRKRFTFF